MKVGLVAKLDKRNKTTSKKIRNDAIPENCDVIVVFSIFWPIWSKDSGLKPDSGCRVCKIYVPINSYPLSYKN